MSGDTIIVQPNEYNLNLTAPGPQGATGPTGPQGPAGQGVPTGGTAGQILIKDSSTDYDTSWESPASIVSFIHTQSSSSSTWNITHNLGWNPNVTVQDSAGTTVEGDIVYHNINSLSITFTAAFAGTAYLS